MLTVFASIMFLSGVVIFILLCKTLNEKEAAEAQVRQLQKEFSQAIDVLFDVQSPKQVPWQDIESFVTKMAGERSIVIKNALLAKLLELLGKKP